MQRDTEDLNISQSPEMGVLIDSVPDDQVGASEGDRDNAKKYQVNEPTHPEQREVSLGEPEAVA